MASIVGEADQPPALTTTPFCVLDQSGCVLPKRCADSGKVAEHAILAADPSRICAIEDREIQRAAQREKALAPISRIAECGA